MPSKRELEKRRARDGLDGEREMGLEIKKSERNRSTSRLPIVEQSRVQRDGREGRGVVEEEKEKETTTNKKTITVTNQ